MSAYELAKVKRLVCDQWLVGTTLEEICKGGTPQAATFIANLYVQWDMELHQKVHGSAVEIFNPNSHGPYWS